MYNMESVTTVLSPSVRSQSFYGTTKHSGMVTHIGLKVEVSFGTYQNLDHLIITILTSEMECSPSIL